MKSGTRTRIKICGITRVEDAVAAARAGADAVGMVFYKPAPRCITLERAREILAILPPFVTPVGLFVDAPVGEVSQAARNLGLRHIQLHGHEDAPVLRALDGFTILKAVRVDRQTFRAELDGWRREIARGGLDHLRGILLETAGAPGGTGAANDWEFVKSCQAEGAFGGLPPIIAAGGLNPGNVAAVVRDVRPWAVDVSSGVEASKGVKSPEKIAAFVEAVHGGALKG
ncbi:MAG TPA: phosphoribosylanthranilate isomerase [Tepidisphaeraceae bacterium]|jgi:phosphoribosylanthranilate isomerase|nr:phosphoribosylanthranilate isomerase [Tepidisphaeraceae bacterium]